MVLNIVCVESSETVRGELVEKTVEEKKSGLEGESESFGVEGWMDRKGNS